MSKYEPKNREEAFVHQFEDDVRVLKCLSQLDDLQAFEKGLEVLETHIASYRNKILYKKAPRKKS